jgi:hypothetical protein
MSEIIGAIYPVPSLLTNRLFESETKEVVFVKYLSRNSTKLLPKHKIIFYASRGQKKLIGEGTIEKVEFLSPGVVLSKYRDVLFLTEDEFLDYVGNRKQFVLTITLKQLVRYHMPIDYCKAITMTGQYVIKGEYSTLMKKAQVVKNQKLK